MPTLEDLLNDASIADDLELDFAGKGKFKVGEFRSAQKSIAAKRGDIEKELKAAEAKRKEMQQLADDAVALIAKLKVEPEPPQPKGKDDIDFDTDPIYGPLVTKKLKPLEAKLAEALDAFDKLSKDFAESAKFVLQRDYARDWNDRVPADKRPKDKTWKDYLKLATEKKILNEFGMPDPVEALNRELEPIVSSAKDKEIADLKATVEELKKQATAPRMPRPGAGAKPGTGEGKSDKTFGSVDELVDAAFADPLIQEIAGGRTN